MVCAEEHGARISVAHDLIEVHFSTTESELTLVDPKTTKRSVERKREQSHLLVEGGAAGVLSRVRAVFRSSQGSTSIRRPPRMPRFFLLLRAAWALWLASFLVLFALPLVVLQLVCSPGHESFAKHLVSPFERWSWDTELCVPMVLAVVIPSLCHRIMVRRAGGPFLLEQGPTLVADYRSPQPWVVTTSPAMVDRLVGVYAGRLALAMALSVLPFYVLMSTSLPRELRLHALPVCSVRARAHCIHGHALRRGGISCAHEPPRSWKETERRNLYREGAIPAEMTKERSGRKAFSDRF